MSTRAAAVAGYFYDADPRRLKNDLVHLLDAQEVDFKALPEALIVPHAGYIYSGSTAACAYKCLLHDPDQVTRVLLIGPAHRVYVEGMAIPAVDYFATPLGDIPLDRGALEEISSLAAVSVLDEAHREEHSLEVQLPFLQTVLNDFTLIPVVVGGAAPAAVAAVIDALAGSEQLLVVISSDLSHHHPYTEAQRIETRTNGYILDRTSALSGEEACGAHAINGLMRARNIRDLNIQTIDLRNSGDTAGDKTRVVGYGTFILH